MKKKKTENEEGREEGRCWKKSWMREEVENVDGVL